MRTPQRQSRLLSKLRRKTLARMENNYVPDGLTEKGAKKNGKSRPVKRRFHAGAWRKKRVHFRLEHRSQVNASLRLWRLRREACLCQDRRSAAMEGCIRNIDLRQNQNNCYEQELKHKHRPRPACHGCPKRNGK